MFVECFWPLEEVEYVLFLNADGEFVAVASDTSEPILLEDPVWS